MSDERNLKREKVRRRRTHGLHCWNSMTRKEQLEDEGGKRGAGIVTPSRGKITGGWKNEE